ncbi:MAG TPA: hypothetical protein VHW09_09505 [Bryobacteraceae bacterium]|jgi:spermidine synthase|nr:hypothetical protein [Bryobacteraceae bacterium]
MTSTPALNASATPRPDVSGCRVPAILSVLTGFSGFLAVEAFNSNLTCLSGFALGSVAGAVLLHQGRVRRPLPAFGVAQVAAGAAGVVFSFWASPLLAALAMALFGAALPLIGDRKDWAAMLAGAVTASILGPFAILPAAGPAGALWLCFGMGATVCAVATLTKSLPIPPVATPPIGRAAQLRLAASFGTGALAFALAAIWAHLSEVVLGSSVYALAWVPAAIAIGCLAGVLLADRRAVRLSTLLQSTALLLTLQLVLWDRAPGWFRFSPAPQHSFYLVEVFRFLVAIVLLAPASAALGAIFARLLPGGHLAVSAALGSLAGALLGTFVLLPLAGSEVALKGLVLTSFLVWIAFLLREQLSRRRLATAAFSCAIVLIVLLGRWWNWATLTAGPAPFRTNVEPARDVRYLPPTFVFQQEDARGGFTTVVEQTVVAGQAAQTVRTLFCNGVFQGDDSAGSGDGGFLAGSQFVADPGSALLIGLGTGRGAAALRRAGYREIAVAEPAPGIVSAAHEYFNGWNEAILADPRVKVYPYGGGDLLLSRRGPYDLIAVELSSIWFAGAADLYSRDFYELAHRRLRQGGIFQATVQIDQLSEREIASELATVRAVFSYVGLWSDGAQAVLVASDRPLTAARSPAREALLDSAGIGRLIDASRPPITSSRNRWLEYAAPRSQSSYDNRESLKRFR